jgi:uncharacterized membrane-anchored protein YhcB (DUF1043 family)
MYFAVMNDNRKIDLQRFVSPKTKWTYLLKFVAYALVIGIILFFISNRLKHSTSTESKTETEEIHNIKIELP